jgi:hypothetical protein
MVTIFNGRCRTSSTSNDTSFIQIEHRILKHLKEFSGNEWIVFTALALHVDNEGRCFPSMARIIHITGLTAPTVRTVMRSLQDKRIDGGVVLAVTDRFADNNRQTSNEYILFPGIEGVKVLEGEGKEFESGEGVKILDPINKSNKELEPINKKPLRTRGVSKKMPADDDPARAIYASFRQWKYPLADPQDFNLSEWTSVNFIIRQMHSKGVDGEALIQACDTLVKKWSNKDMVTIHSVWKHWSTATQTDNLGLKTSSKKLTTVEHAQSAMNVMQSINNLLDNNG